MSVPKELREQAMNQMQGAMALNIAFIGIYNALFATLAEMGKAAPDELAAKTGLDKGYVERWCDAAFCFGFLDEVDEKLKLTELGHTFIPDAPGTAMPFAVQSILSGHMAERAAVFMRSGEQPGEEVLAERKSILTLFGPMLEAMSGSLFEEQVLKNVPVFREADKKDGLVLDLGCGNGWYLRKLAMHFPCLHGIGIDDFQENINHAMTLTQKEGLGSRLTFIKGDIYGFSLSKPVDLIAMNRALHHVWSDRQTIFQIFKKHLKNGGSAVIWEPNWPKRRSDLRDPAKRGMAFQNLAEHIMGNHFLCPEEIEAEFHRVDMETATYLFANGNEAVVVGTKKLR